MSDVVQIDTNNGYFLYSPQDTNLPLTIEIHNRVDTLSNGSKVLTTRVAVNGIVHHIMSQVIKMSTIPPAEEPEEDSEEYEEYDTGEWEAIGD